eukprot:scaffold1626_cov178-Alexandrium_tamarense.AAC.17
MSVPNDPTSSTSTANDASVAEEGIMVAIRMRPLNSRESTTNNNEGSSKSNRVWRTLTKYNSITQCTSEGKPLPERINNRNFFTYDRTFGESSTTRQVYDDVAKGIVRSVSNGLNGTIFAYGQTSSGKTYTMQGSGSIEDGSANYLNNGGIVHMAASDIFNHIEKETERVFLVRVSFIEIYNEEVRDLLVSGGDDGTLSVREDPRRGVFVNSNETIVTGLDSLLSVLFAGEKNRSVASTGMNERSSRSHTIFRITVESRSKSDGENDDDDGSGDEEEMEDARMSDNTAAGAVRVSTLNLVDLAGSESVRHTGNTGERQKEGGKINQSLLTLSRVIGSLGQNATHINFRDSKLTRILQPSLSGNARMAVICCATPSELYLEETRSTLQFASRAKLVKTRAQVNEVLDDRSLIKKLQKELKEARKAGDGHVAIEQMKALEEKAANEGEAKRKAEQDLKRMKELILKGGVLPGNICLNGAGKSSLFKSLFVYNDDTSTIKSSGDVEVSLSVATKRHTKRRFSDGVINDTSNQGRSTPLRNASTFDDDAAQEAGYASPQANVNKFQAKTEMKLKRPKHTGQISASDLTDEVDIGLLREALASKSAQAADLKAKLEASQKHVQSVEKKLQAEHGEKEMLRLAKEELESQVSSLASDKEFVLCEQDIVMTEKEDAMGTSLQKIEGMLVERKEQAKTVTEMKDLVASLEEQLANAKDENEAEASSWKEKVELEQSECQSQVEALQTQMAELKTFLDNAVAKSAQHEATIHKMQVNLERSEVLLAEANANNVTLQESLDAATAENEQLTTGNAEQAERITELEESSNTSSQALESSNAEVAKLTEQLSMAEDEKNSLQKKLEDTDDTLTETAQKLEKALADSSAASKNNEADQQLITDLKATISTFEEEKEQLETAMEEMKSAVSECKVKLKQTESDLEASANAANGAKTAFANQLRGLEKERDDLRETIAEKVSIIAESESTITALNENIQSSRKSVEDLTTRVYEHEATISTLEGSLETEKLAVEELERHLEDAEDNVVRLTQENNAAAARIQELETGVAELISEKDGMVTDILDMTSQLSIFTAERDEITTLLEDSKEQLSNAHIEIAAFTNKIEELESKVEAVCIERDTADTRLRELMSGNESTEAVMEAMQVEKEKLSSKLEESKKEIVQLETNEASLTESIINLEGNVERLQNKLDNSTAKVEELEAQMEVVRCLNPLLYNCTAF